MASFVKGETKCLRKRIERISHRVTCKVYGSVSPICNKALHVICTAYVILSKYVRNQ